VSEPIELDEAARGVIAAGRDGVAPNDFVAERLRRSIDRALGGSAPPPRSRTLRASVLMAFGAAALGGALYAGQLMRSVPAPSPQRVPVASPVSVPPTAAPRPLPTGDGTPPARVAEPARPTTKSGTSAGPAESSKPSRSEQLGQEIELLARVNAAVNAGDGRRALELIADYDRRFRPGILGEERTAASVLALCAAGRTSEAKAAAERLTRSSPRSPLLGRIASSCAGSR